MRFVLSPSQLVLSARSTIVLNVLTPTFVGIGLVLVLGT